MRAQVWQSEPHYWNYDLGVGHWADDKGFRVIVDGLRHFRTWRLAYDAACEDLHAHAELSEWLP